MTQNSPQIISFHKISPLAEKDITINNSPNTDLFEIRRTYWIKYNNNEPSLSEHANKTIQQIIIPLHGELNIELEDSKNTKFQYTLNEHNKGLYIPPMYWKKIHYNSPLILLCFASEKFDENDYIRNYTDFKKYQNNLCV